MILLASLFAGCGEEDSKDNQSLEFQRVARIQILNTFSITDSTIRTIAFNSSIIDSISDDRGGSSNSGEVNRMRAWSLQLKSDIDPDQRSKLIAFLDSVGDGYLDLCRDPETGSTQYQFSYDVSQKSDRIDIKATGSFARK